MSDEPLMVDDYQLINCIASGNDTQVWEALAGSRRVALKLMHPEARKERDKVAVLKAEGKVGRLFDHPNIIKVHETVVNKKNAYLVLDYFRAPNLKSQIHNDLYSVQLRMKKLVESLCMALAHIHDRKWVHRDVKPDNILMNRGSEVRLIDFSLAHKIKRGKMKEIQGTKSYIAPETLMRRGPTRQTDMYSLGVTLFLALTGEFPITGLTPQDLLKNHLKVIPATPSTLNQNITPELDEFVLKLLAKKPADRFKTMDEAYSVVRGLKMFKENVEEVETKRKQKEEESLRDGVDAARLLDSRSDAERTILRGGTEAVSKPRPENRKPQPQPQPRPANPKVATAPPQPPQPIAQPQPAMAMPTPVMAGYPPQPQQMAPGQMPPGMPPQYYPGMPMPAYGAAPMPGGYPGMPMQGGMPMPPQPYPQMPPAGIPPAPQQQNPTAPPPPTPAVVPTQTATPESTPNSDEDLPFMDELPDVL